MTGTTISIDTGGTFTDGFVLHEGEVHTVKTLTTPHDLLVCFRNVIEQAAAAVGLDVPALLRRVEVIRYATTIGTNQIVERTGPRLGLLAFEGSDAACGVGVFVEPEMVATLDAHSAGDAALPAVRGLLHRGARGLVVSAPQPAAASVESTFTEHYPRHCLDAVPLLRADELSPDTDRARRTATALFNAYLHPSAADFLYRAEDYLRDAGYRRPLLIVNNDGGATRVARTIAGKTYNSGPMAGLLGAREIGRRYGLDTLITLDMGGTSLDVGVIAEGRAVMVDHGQVAGVTISFPLPRLEPFGAGGGSIAWLDGETLRVGPRSAGAHPGPACFGLGGTEPTVTDADVVTGVLRPETFLGGSMPLDLDAAHRAFEPLAEALGCSVPEAAVQVRATLHRGAGQQLAEQLTTWELDPTDVTVLAFGGNGATHCASIAHAAGIRDVLVVPFAPVFSAYGASTVDVVHAHETADTGPEAEQALREAVLRDMRGEGYAPGQVEVDVERISGDGHDVTRVTGRHALPHASSRLLSEATAAPELRDHPVQWDRGDAQPTPVVDLTAAAPGFTLDGPALADARSTTCVVPPGWTLTVDDDGAARLRPTEGQ